MRIWRCFSWDGRSKSGHGFGSPLYVPVNLQGVGRFDIVKSDGVFYASLDKESAIAEYLKVFRGLAISHENLQASHGLVKALAAYEVNPVNIADLRDPKVLDKTHIQPARIMSRDREVTQQIAQGIYDKGYDGLFYWSALQSEWSNVALFISKVKSKLKIATVERLKITSDELLAAAGRVDVQIISPKKA